MMRTAKDLSLAVPSAILQRVAIALVLVAVALVNGGQASAAHPAPDTFQNRALAYRNIVASGDLFFLLRYELETSTATSTTDAWCAELVVTTGCDSDPVAPTDPESLNQGRAVMTFYSAAGPSTLETQVHPPRIDHALGGLYFDPGHGLTWGSVIASACIESSTTFFSAPTQDCLVPEWNAAAPDQAAQLAQLESDLPTVLLELQTARDQALTTYVNNVGLVTTEGRVFAIEALGVIDRIIPDAFQVSSESALTVGFTPVAGSNLQTSIDATAVAVGITASLDNIGAYWFGISGAALATMALLIVGVGLGGGIQAVTRQPVLASLGFFTPLTWGIYLRAPTVAVLFVLITIMATLASWWFLKKSPAP